MNLGKLTVPNVFVNVKLQKVIIGKHNANDRCIYDGIGEKFMEILIDYLNEVFKLMDGLTKRFSFMESKNENKRSDISYMQWKLILNKVKKEPLIEVDGPPFNIQLFKIYFDM